MDQSATAWRLWWTDEYRYNEGTFVPLNGKRPKLIPYKEGTPPLLRTWYYVEHDNAAAASSSIKRAVAVVFAMYRTPTPDYSRDDTAMVHCLRYGAAIWHKCDAPKAGAAAETGRQRATEVYDRKRLRWTAFQRFRKCPIVLRSSDVDFHALTSEQRRHLVRGAIHEHGVRGTFIVAHGYDVMSKRGMVHVTYTHRIKKPIVPAEQDGKAMHGVDLV